MARKKNPNAGIAVEIEDIDLVQHIKDCYYEYGTLTLEDRSLPDYRDGLLKVHRRTLWSLGNLAPFNKPQVKSARIVGDTLGRLHPHGDTATYGALTSMVNSPNALASGTGNWGSQTDDAAAMRYTLTRMSELGHSLLFHEDYLPACEMIENYDGKDVEPLLLPALLPNVLLNGVEGIAVGLATRIPSFEQAGVLKLVKMLLQGKKLTPAIVKKTLVPTFTYGGYAPLDEEWQTGADSLIKTGKGSLYVYGEWVHSNKTTVLTALPPRVNYDKFMDKLAESGWFSSVTNTMGSSSTTHAEITLAWARGTKEENVEDWLNEYFFATIPYQIAVVERYYDEDTKKVRANILQLGIIDLLEKWVEWRKELEMKMLECRLVAYDKKASRKNLLLLAQENRKTIASSWEKEDAVSFIKTTLKISEDDAKEILGLRISQLTKLDRDKIKLELDELKKQTAATKKAMKAIDVSTLDSTVNIFG